MIASNYQPDSGSCSTCSSYNAAAGNSPTTSCPTCGRAIPDVTDALRRISIPSEYLEVLPKSLARERETIAYDVWGDTLVLLRDIHSSPSTNQETFEMLRFVLNMRLVCLHANEHVIREAIDRDYEDG